jgi:hypothetical protein
MRPVTHFRITDAGNTIFYGQQTHERQSTFSKIETFCQWDTPLERVKLKRSRYDDVVGLHKKARDGLLEKIGVTTIGDLVRACEINYESVSGIARGEYCGEFYSCLRELIDALCKVPSYDSKGSDKMVAVPVSLKHLIIDTREVDGVTRDDVKELSNAIECYLEEKKNDIIKEGLRALKRKKLEQTRAEIAALEDKMRELEESIKDEEQGVA